MLTLFNDLLITTEDIMAQDKKRNMEESSDKKERMAKDEAEKTASHKIPGKSSTTPSKNNSSSSRKSR